MLLNSERKHRPETEGSGRYQRISDGGVYSRIYYQVRNSKVFPSPMKTSEGGSLLSGALSKALCCKLKLKWNMFPLFNPLAIDVHRTVLDHQYFQGRILTIQASEDVASQYIPFMNTVFSAQKFDIAMDTCVLHPKGSPFGQQACSLTGGQYLEVSMLFLIGFLLW